MKRKRKPKELTDTQVRQMMSPAILARGYFTILESNRPDFLGMPVHMLNDIGKVTSYDVDSGFTKIEVKDGIAVGYLFSIGIPLRYIIFKYNA